MSPSLANGYLCTPKEESRKQMTRDYVGYMSQPAEIGAVAASIRSATKVVVLTGAGISTESGIPDFRGPQGLWTKNPEAQKLSHIQYYVADRDVRVRAWKARKDLRPGRFQPNRGHSALVELEKKGRLDTLVTQNIDSLHLDAGTSPEILIEVHGHVREVVCLECGERAPMERALARVDAGEEDPDCRSCGGILKSATVSFGQQLVEEDLDRAFHAASTCDVLLAIGSTLEVTPVAYMPEYALRAGAELVIINAEPTPFDRSASAVFRTPIGEVLPDIVSRV